MGGVSCPPLSALPTLWGQEGVRLRIEPRPLVLPSFPKSRKPATASLCLMYEFAKGPWR